MSSESSGDSSSASNNSGVPQRRGSITEYFRPPPSSGAYQGPITSAAAQANHRRRMSYSGGVTGTSPNPAWFSSFPRRGSISSVSSTASSPTADEEEKSPVDDGQRSQGSFARRLSFGARALRDVKKSMSFGTVGEGEPSNTQEELSKRPSMAAQPDAAMPPPAAPVSAKRKGPDEMQERILKGDFYY